MSWTPSRTAADMTTEEIMKKIDDLNWSLDTWDVTATTEVDWLREYATKLELERTFLFRVIDKLRGPEVPK